MLHSSKIIAFVYFPLIIVLLIPYSIIIGADIPFRFSFTDLEEDNWFTILQISIGVSFLLFSGLAVLIDRVFKSRGWKPRSLLRGSVVGGLSVGLVFLMQDAPAYEFPYTWDDVPAVSSENRGSYDLLVEKLMRPESNIEIKDSGEVLQMAMDDPIANENEILEKWGDAKEAHKLVAALDRYGQIADLSTPKNAINLNIMTMAFLSRYYRAYALLMAEKGRWEEAVMQLRLIHSVACKALPHARYLIHKLIWTSVAEGCVHTAFQLARHPRTDQEILKQILLAFPPLDDIATSFRGALISETMFILSTVDSEITTDTIITKICESIPNDDNCESWWNRRVLQLLSIFCYEAKTPENHIHQYMGIMIQACSQHPPAIAKALSDLESLERPIFGNTFGWIYSNYSSSHFTDYPKRLAELRVFRDLLQLFLQSRIGVERTMPDYLCDGEYLLTGKLGIFKSAGWDCIAGTEDDIAFDSNP